MSDSPNLLLPEWTDLWQQTLNWSPTPTQQAQFQALLIQLCELNKSVNLTRITDPEDFWEKHLWDSLWGIQPWLNHPSEDLRAIDIGTGGGFPGCPVAIVQPQWQVTLLDSTRKKVACLEALCQGLPLSNAYPVCDRAEELGKNPRYRGKFDVALIRAVGPVSSCAEYAIPFLKVGGTAVVYRGQWSIEEEQILQRALTQLGSELTDLRAITTPLTQSQRHCLHLKKVQSTPSKFPRKVGLPTQQPLGIE
ncbi:MAG: 16S rRNA (guanine(527)-N(7))-methyltransferase RsmG [Acaryochloridaceae cyanobacterium RU_4_10]|nr:16S rRNA (guanine(527)-N(7))-methyltransferase RsmG [Acaryochloridaceae cyanobacterium RU_4_10]